MVNHGHIYVNGKKVDIPSYRTKVGDVITLRNNSKAIEMFKENFLSTPTTYPYLEKDMDNLSGKIIKTPTLEDVNIDVKYSKVFEFYSRN